MPNSVRAPFTFYFRRVSPPAQPRRGQWASIAHAWRWIRLSLTAGLLLSGCAGHLHSQPAGNLTRYEFSRPEMGVPFRIVLFAPDENVAEQAAVAAFDRVRQLNARLSDYETDSELNQLSRTAGQGRAVHVSDDLWNVLERSQQLAALSDGAFDITVGPYVSLWRRARRMKQLPEAATLAEVRPAVGYRNLVLNARDHSVMLVVHRMKLDLGGIAKGYAVDEAMKVLRARGLTRALVGGVGDIRVGDPPPDAPGWRIGIADFDAPGVLRTNRHLLLRNLSVSTSGDAAQRLEIGGRRYSHIVDPRTGIGLTDHSLVTVIARDCTSSDALATAISVLGPEKGRALLRHFPGAQMRIVRKPDQQVELYESAGFARFYVDGAVSRRR